MLEEPELIVAHAALFSHVLSCRLAFSSSFLSALLGAPLDYCTTVKRFGRLPIFTICPVFFALREAFNDLPSPAILWLGHKSQGLVSAVLRVSRAPLRELIQTVLEEIYAISVFKYYLSLFKYGNVILLYPSQTLISPAFSPVFLYAQFATPVWNFKFMCALIRELKVQQYYFSYISGTK